MEILPAHITTKIIFTLVRDWQPAKLWPHLFAFLYIIFTVNLYHPMFIHSFPFCMTLTFFRTNLFGIRDGWGEKAFRKN